VPLPNDDRDGLRRCRDCGDWKPLADFHASPRRPTGRGSYCKPCYNERAKASYAKRVKAKYGREVRQPREVPVGHRYCPDCQTIKPLAEFPRNRAGRGDHGRYCKPCHNVKSRENREKHHGSTREYHLRHRYGIGQRESTSCSRSRVGCARSVARRIRSMWTMTTRPGTSAAYCASTATADSGSSATTSAIWRTPSSTCEGPRVEP
jgi:hypothetical protein